VRRGHSGFALWIVLSCGLGANGQSADPSPATPDAVRAHLRSEHFSPLTTVAALPAGLRQALSQLFNAPTLDMADPGAPFQATDVMITPRLPARRLVAAGCSADHCLVYYERGGFAHTWHVALFHWTPAATRFEWGADGPGGLATIGEVQKAVLAGELKGSIGPW